MNYRFDSDAFTRRPAAMLRLYLIDLYDPRQNLRPSVLKTAPDRATAEREAETYAEDRHLRLRGVTFVCETPEQIEMEI